MPNKGTTHWCEYLWEDTNPEDTCCSMMLTPIIKQCKQCVYIRAQQYEIKQEDNNGTS